MHGLSMTGCGLTLAYDDTGVNDGGWLSTVRGTRMKVVCSWSRKEGRAEFVGEKAPLDDARETHGICVLHRDQIRQHWHASIQARRTTSFLGAASTFALFRWTGLLNFTKKIRS